jgi:hypothetical protein
MKNSIKVDYEWAFNEVVSTHDFKDKRPDWIAQYVRSWMDGYLEGYFAGIMEVNIRCCFVLKQYNISVDIISKVTGLSDECISMIKDQDSNT